MAYKEIQAMGAMEWAVVLGLYKEVRLTVLTSQRSGVLPRTYAMEGSHPAISTRRKRIVDQCIHSSG